MIRRATEGDIPAIVEMSRKFYATTSYAGFTPMDDDTVAELTRGLLGHVMLVAEVDGQVCGMAGLFLAPFMFNRSARTAHEVVWWVDPEAQGAGVGKALLQAIVAACKEAGCSAIQMIALASSPPQAGMIYERAGFAHSETCYTMTL